MIISVDKYDRFLKWNIIGYIFVRNEYKDMFSLFGLVKDGNFLIVVFVLVKIDNDSKVRDIRNYCIVY